MKRRDFLVGATSLILPTPALAQYATAPGARVTGIYVRKHRREMFLMHHDKVVAQYLIQLGSRPVGHKRQEGDGRTPEGRYRITHKNPNSAFHLSLGISYPNQQDIRQARQRNVSPGGDIFIHGRGPARKNTIDWTAGCIAVEDHEMDTVFRKVRAGIPIQIDP